MEKNPDLKISDEPKAPNGPAVKDPDEATFKDFFIGLAAMLSLVIGLCGLLYLSNSSDRDGKKWTSSYVDMLGPSLYKLSSPGQTIFSEFPPLSEKLSHKSLGVLTKVKLNLSLVSSKDDSVSSFGSFFSEKQDEINIMSHKSSKNGRVYKTSYEYYVVLPVYFNSQKKLLETYQSHLEKMWKILDVDDVKDINFEALNWEIADFNKFVANEVVNYKI